MEQQAPPWKEDRTVSDVVCARTAGWPLMVLGGVIFLVGMGIRESFGLFVHPMMSGTTLSLMDISMALAVGQLAWGVCQPIFGAVADKNGPLHVLVLGAACTAVAQVGLAWTGDFWTVLLLLGILAPAGAAANSFSVLMGATSARLPAVQRPLASGVISALGSAGNLLLAPVAQLCINIWGYPAALRVLAACSLCVIPLAWRLCPLASHAPKEPLPAPEGGLPKQLRLALGNPGYLLLHLSFFACGFHVSFIIAHLPGEVDFWGLSSGVAAACIALIGLFSFLGSIGTGWLGGRFKMKYLLCGLYFSRAAVILLFLLLPKAPWVFYFLAAMTGISWMAMLTPTAGLVGAFFGLRYQATLFGLVLFTHQAGGFCGAWLGGLAMEHLGGYVWVWRALVALALLAALACLGVREPAPRRAHKKEAL